MAWDEAVAEAARARGHPDVGVTVPPSLSSRYSPASPRKRSFHPLISEPPLSPPPLLAALSSTQRFHPEPRRSPQPPPRSARPRGGLGRLEITSAAVSLRKCHFLGGDFSPKCCRCCPSRVWERGWGTGRTPGDEFSWRMREGLGHRGLSCGFSSSIPRDYPAWTLLLLVLGEMGASRCCIPGFGTAAIAKGQL